MLEPPQYVRGVLRSAKLNDHMRTLKNLMIFFFKINLWLRKGQSLSPFALKSDFSRDAQRLQHVAKFVQQN